MTERSATAILEKAVSKAVAAPEAMAIFENSGITVDYKSAQELSKLILADYDILNKYKEFIK